MKIFTLLLFILPFSAFALTDADRGAIEQVIQNYTDSWNLNGGKGFGDGFTEDADFVNIFGAHFSGPEEIEERHTKILSSVFKGSTLEITDTKLREVQPGVVIGLVSWKLMHYRMQVAAELSKILEIRSGIFTQVFIQKDGEWKITASQNTVIPN